MNVSTSNSPEPHHRNGDSSRTSAEVTGSSTSPLSFRKSRFGVVPVARPASSPDQLKILHENVRPANRHSLSITDSLQTEKALEAAREGEFHRERKWRTMPTGKYNCMVCEMTLPVAPDIIKRYYLFLNYCCAPLLMCLQIMYFSSLP